MARVIVWCPDTLSQHCACKIAPSGSPLWMQGDAMDTNLALVALERVRDGTLPLLTQFRTYGGCGSGACCAVCGYVIPQDKMEIDVEYGTKVEAETLVMH